MCVCVPKMRMKKKMTKSFSLLTSRTTSTTTRKMIIYIITKEICYSTLTDIAQSCVCENLFLVHHSRGTIVQIAKQLNSNLEHGLVSR